MDRRDFVRAASATALSALPLGAVAAAATTDVTIKNARIVSMDPAIGDLRRGDVVVSGGKIRQVGVNLTAAGRVIDGTNFIVMPGLVNCMDHMWTSVFKGLVGDNATVSYTGAKVALGPYTTPADAYASTYYSALAYLNAGVTTICNQNHNAKSQAHVEQGIKAMTDAGLRGQMTYSYYDGLPDTQATDWAAVAAVKQSIANGLGRGTVSLAFGPRSDARTGAALFTSEIQNAQKLGLAFSLEGPRGTDLVEMARLRALGPNVHALEIGLSAADLQLLRTSGASMEVEPFAFYNIGITSSLTGVYNVVNTGINVGISTDNLTGAANPSILDQARFLTITMHGASGDGFAYQHSKAIKAATLNGAKALNMDSQIGSLTPGKEADLILVRTNSLTMTNTENLNPYRLLFTAQTGDVDTVMVGGKILKQNGVMIGIDVNQVQRSLAASLARLRAAANWPTVPY